MKNPPNIKIKLSYVTGLRSVVLDELARHSGFHIVGEDDASIYVEFSEDLLLEVTCLRSVARAYLTLQDTTYNPSYISSHKSILGNLIDIVVKKDGKSFNSFKISCAGSDSPEVRGIARYVQETYGLAEKDEADLKIHLIKHEDIWEIGVQITPRPLSVRDYKVVNMSGAMDPTVAYAVNFFCLLEKARSYLNIFSGSGTLLIEAGQSHPNLEKLVGFDNNKKHLSLSIKNIKKAGLVKKVTVEEGDIFDRPNLGTFDAIAADLPFGMSISKNENLGELYETFVTYCEGALNSGGRLVAYTSEYQLLEATIKKSKLKIIQTLELQFMTSVNAYLRPKIIVCEFTP
jgi:tRNA (guanine6-N2)-methyltransferase